MSKYVDYIERLFDISQLNGLMVMTIDTVENTYLRKPKRYFWTDNNNIKHGPFKSLDQCVCHYNTYTEAIDIDPNVIVVDFQNKTRR